MKKVVVLLILIAAAGLMGWRVYVRVSQQGDADGWGRGRGPRAVAVEVAPVERRTVRDVGEFTGTLMPHSQFIAAPKVSGRLETLRVNIGDPVRNGDLIAELDSEEYAQQVAQARAELEVSKASLADAHSNLEVAAREFERAQELRKQQVASEAELDQARARHRAAEALHEVAQAQIRQKEAELRAAQVRLSYTRIHAAWIDGQGPRFVAERFVDEGAMLRANDPIVSIVDVDTVLAVIYVIERDFPAIRIGQPVAIMTDAYGDREFEGALVRRAPVLREESRQARVEVEVPNPDGLLAPGMFVRARIKFAEHADATVAPAASLVRRDDQQGVFVVDPAAKTARFVPIEVGIIDGEWAEVRSPALEGRVVTLGQHLLEDGASIMLPRDEAGPATQPSAQGGKGRGGRL